MLVPIIATIVPGAVTCTAGADTWASTFATATGVPGRNPVHAAAHSLNPPARLPMGTMLRDIFVVDNPLKRGLRAAKYVVGREAVSLVPHRFVACRAVISGLCSSELPDDPVCRVDEPFGSLGRSPDPRSEFAGTSRRTTLTRSAAIAVEPWLSSRRRNLGDQVRFGLRGMVLPQLDPGVRMPAPLLEETQRGAVDSRGEHRAGREIDADTDNVARIDARFDEKLAESSPETCECSLQDPARAQSGSSRTSAFGSGRCWSITPFS